MASTKLLFTALAVALALPATMTAEVKCDQVAKALSSAITSAGSQAKVLQLMEEALLGASDCACDIVKAAITSSNADQQFVGEIVKTAASAVPTMTPAIAECAMSVSPESGESIRVALEEVLTGEGVVGKSGVSYGGSSYTGGGKSSSYSAGGKSVSYSSTGKTVVTESDDSYGSGDFGKAPVDIRGIYLIPPAVGGFGGFGTTEVIREVVDIADVDGASGGSTTAAAPAPVIVQVRTTVSSTPVAPAGSIVTNPEGEVIGVVGPDGVILDPDGEVIGVVNPDGVPIGTNGEVLGEVGEAPTSTPPPYGDEM